MPMAIPSSTAMVLNSLATPPALQFVRRPVYRDRADGRDPVQLGERVHNRDNRLTEIGVGHPVARHSARAPAILRP